MLRSGDALSVKVCGVTRSEDAHACAAAGVDMLGLNFWPRSRRHITSAHAAEIVEAVRAKSAAIKFVGVFVDQPIEFVQSIARHLALDALQLHGGETPDYIRRLEVPMVIKALRVGPEFSLAMAAKYKCAILLDGWSDTVPGGTGQTFPWEVAAALRSNVEQLILAGGLTAENVSEAIRIVQPNTVDVCSGVEAAPGRKSIEKLRRFIDAARNADAAVRSRV